MKGNFIINKIQASVCFLIKYGLFTVEWANICNIIEALAIPNTTLDGFMKGSVNNTVGLLRNVLLSRVIYPSLYRSRGKL